MSQTFSLVVTEQSDVSDMELTPLPPRPAPVFSTFNAKTAEELLAEPLPPSPNMIPDISKWQTSVIIGTVACATMLNSLLTGLLVVGLPTMAKDLNLDRSLLLWPASVNALTCGCTMLLSGSIADVLGGRNVYLVGCFFLVATTVACSVCRTGIELILFRAFQGVAMSLCLPSAVKLITANIPTGSRRNIAFACLGAAQPVGFSMGLVLGGFFVEGIGWRYGYYIGAIMIFMVFIISIFGMPKDRHLNSPITLKRMRTEVDWIGCLILSTSLGSYSYVFSVLASGASHILEPSSLTLLILATILIPLFGIHVRRQERSDRVVIIPTSIWSNTHFTSLCTIVFLVWSVFQAVQFFLTLYFQEVLLLEPIPTSLRFLPMVVTGSLANFVSGNLVAHVAANYLVLCTALISAASPLIMALVNTDTSYWLSAFWAIALVPICADVLFTISNLIITEAFPDKMHGIAGGVFNTVSNIGTSVGLAITAVIAASVTMAKEADGRSDADKLMAGYRAAFWACFAASITVLAVVGLGMRRIGKVGLKRE